MSGRGKRAFLKGESEVRPNVKDSVIGRPEEALMDRGRGVKSQSKGSITGLRASWP